MTLLSLNVDGSKLYVSSYIDQNTETLFEYTFANKKMGIIFHHETSDILKRIENPQTGIVVGVEVMPGYVEYHYVDRDDEFAVEHAKLAKTFSGSDIHVTSITKNQKMMVVLVVSDKNAGDYYLYNKENKSISYLLSKRSWIDPELMSERKPIQFKARDGEIIHGYLTLPRKANGTVPLVTYVHGGPYGIRDYWWFDSEAQMLANNGYAVLQVNYRGSGGYGKKYEEIAYQKRSTLIQHDIIDGTKWALSLAEITNNKACIMGGSFGGYSALMSPLIEPDLFNCSIAHAGVYEAIEQEQDADYSEISSFAAEAAEVYGAEEKLLKKESPLTYIDQLKIPVFIVHGGKDERVTPKQAYLLKEALDERNMPYEWMFKEKEGHGFFNEDNQVEFYSRTLEFLKKHLH